MTLEASGGLQAEDAGQIMTWGAGFGANLGERLLVSAHLAGAMTGGGPGESPSTGVIRAAARAGSLLGRRSSTAVHAAMGWSRAEGQSRDESARSVDVAVLTEFVVRETYASRGPGRLTRYQGVYVGPRWWQTTFTDRLRPEADGTRSSAGVVAGWHLAMLGQRSAGHLYVEASVLRVPDGWAPGTSTRYVFVPAVGVIVGRPNRIWPAWRRE